MRQRKYDLHQLPNLEIYKLEILPSAKSYMAKSRFYHRFQGLHFYIGK